MTRMVGSAFATLDMVGDAVGGNVATKADLQELRTGMKADLQNLALRLTHQFDSLSKHLWAMSAGIVTVVVALMKLLS